MLTPTPLEMGQAYATVADIRDCADLPEMPITPHIIRVTDGGMEPLWTRPDGTPLTILIRALSFAERREVQQAAGDDDDTAVLEASLRGIKEPRFSREQLTEVLATKHPAALDQIAEAIYRLCDLPAGMVEREIRRLSGLPKEPKRQKKRAVAGSVAETAE